MTFSRGLIDTIPHDSFLKQDQVKCDWRGETEVKGRAKNKIISQILKYVHIGVSYWLTEH
jgi:hypothetical protein